MKRCEDIAEVQYQALVNELRKGKSVQQAMIDAYNSGAPRVFMSYELVRRHLSVRYHTGKWDVNNKRKHLIRMLDVLYEWWIERTKDIKGKRYKYMCLHERMEQPTAWPFSFYTFQTRIYRYRRGEFSKQKFYN